MTQVKTTALPWADHLLLHGNLSDWLSLPKSHKSRSAAHKILRRDFKEISPSTFSSQWVHCSRNDLPVEELDAIFHTKLVLARNLLCPLRQIRRKPPVQFRNRWFQPSHQKLKTKGRTLERRWRKHRRPSDLAIYQSHQHSYKLSLKQAKAAFIQQQITQAPNATSKLFRLAKDLSTAPAPRDTEHPPTNAQAFCNGIANHFQDKIHRIRQGILQTHPSSDSNTPGLESSELLPQELPQSHSLGLPTSIGHILHSSSPPTFPHNLSPLLAYQPVSEEEVRKVIMQLGPSSSPLDPFPTSIIKTLLPDLLQDITKMVNASLTTGEVPIAWKRGVVTPLLKKPGADTSDFNNFRPVTQLRLLTRITEHIITSQTQLHLEAQDRLHDSQSGFRPKRSTEMAVADMREALLLNSDQHHASALILLDLSAAFDTVQHNILLDRCESVAGISHLAKKWLQSFLKDRTQQVKLEDTWSATQELACGVPQGSSLSPLLFNIYMQPLALLLEKFHLKFQFYADDVQIMVNLDSEEKDRLIPCMEALKSWMSQSYLQLNSQKTEVLILDGKKSSIPTQVPWPASWGSPPPPSNHVRNLGMLLNTKGDGDTHAIATAKSCHFQLNMASKLFPFLNLKQRKVLSQAWVGSRLGYGSFLYLGAYKKTIYRVQKAQNRAIRLIFSLPRSAHISPWRKRLGWLSVTDLIEFRICLWFWRMKNKISPKYTQKWICPGHITRPLRSAQQQLLPVRKILKTTKGGRTLSHKGAKLWNALPLELRNCTSFPHFKKELKFHLLHRAGEEAPGPSLELQGNQRAFAQPSTAPPNQQRGLIAVSSPPRTFPLQDSTFDPLPLLPQTLHAFSPHMVYRTTTPVPNARVRRTTTPVPNVNTQHSRISPHQDSASDPHFLPAELPQASFPPLASRITTSAPNANIRRIWGVSSPPLPRRDNTALINLALHNKLRLRAAGRYALL